MNTNYHFSPNWEKLNIEDFNLHFGDIVSLKKENQLIQGIVLDFSEDIEGKWYGICFIEKGKLFGRKISNGFFGKRIDLLNLVYLNEAAIHNLHVDKNLSINFEKIGIGSKCPTQDISFYAQCFHDGIEQRIKDKIFIKPSFFSLNPKQECYFDIKEIMT